MKLTYLWIGLDFIFGILNIIAAFCGAFSLFNLIIGVCCLIIGIVLSVICN